ncbi:hypothetical protein BGZ96_003340 [Linnemannia gamsii]|uniref:Galactose oxidase n=1 Tax=Linnemannia gamsii TaxID=64522 RepID=A0ABQ7JK32_9FUNG|nr:hypothetical protein BGZ96_003340 [Linnemannia gamsii]
MAYTTINEDTFYIQGGTLITGTGSSTNSSQFYALDLTQPTWNTLNPPWKALVYPADLNALSPTEGHSIAVAPDSNSFTMWIYNPNLIVEYDVSSGIWSQVRYTPPLTLFKGNDLQAATDPTSGFVYIPGAAGTPNSMSVYTPSTTGMALSIPIPSTLVAATGFYTFVWSQLRKTFIYYGGNSATVNPFFEFSPSAGKWTAMPSTGSIPPFQIRSCMVPAYNGTKMILFGGNTETTQSVDSLFILDVPSMSWTKAPNSLDARSDMGCSVSGDNFIVWGGYKRNPESAFVPSSPSPIIYNLNLGQWTTTFTRGSHPSLSVDPTNSGGGGGVNGAAIAGGIAAAVVIIAVIAFFLIRKHRQRNRHRQPTISKESEADGQQHGRRDSALPSIENAASGPAPYNYTQLNPENNTYNHKYSQIDPENTYNYNYSHINTVGVYSNDNDYYDYHNNHSKTQEPQAFAMTDRQKNQDHIRELEYQIEMGKQQLAYANQNMKSPNNPQYTSTPLELLISGPRDPQGAGIPVVSTATAPQSFDQTELVRKIENMQAELRNLHAQLKY